MATRAHEDIAWVATELEDLAILLRVHQLHHIAAQLTRVRLLLQIWQRSPGTEQALEHVLLPHASMSKGLSRLSGRDRSNC